MKIEEPKPPEEWTFESLQAYKCALREYDLKRIEAGEATPSQVQWENSVIKPSKFPCQARVISFATPRAKKGRPRAKKG